MEMIIEDSGSSKEAENELVGNDSFVTNEQREEDNDADKDDEIEDDYDLLRHAIYKSHNSAVIPSLSATGSVLLDSINLECTDSFTTPLVPGPASSFSAIYTGLMQEQGISVWSSGPNAKIVVPLDLDLYEKVYFLIHSRDDLRDSLLFAWASCHPLAEPTFRFKKYTKSDSCFFNIYTMVGFEINKN